METFYFPLPKWLVFEWVHINGMGYDKETLESYLLKSMTQDKVSKIIKDIGNCGCTTLPWGKEELHVLFD